MDSTRAETLVADLPQAIDATPSGCLFADWISRRGCAKSTAYRMRSELGISCEKRRQGTTVEVWLSAADEALLDAYADALGRGLGTAEALAAVGRPGPAGGALMESDGAHRSGAIVPSDSIEPTPAPPMESDGAALQALRWRLAALRDAVELGAPLSTAEVAMLLGARPGGAQVTRGRLQAVRQARNVWTIEPD